MSCVTETLQTLAIFTDHLYHCHCHGGVVAPATHHHVLLGGNGERIHLSVPARNPRVRHARHGGAERGGQAGEAGEGLSVVHQARQEQGVRWSCLEQRIFDRI